MFVVECGVNTFRRLRFLEPEVHRLRVGFQAQFPGVDQIHGLQFREPEVHRPRAGLESWTWNPNRTLVPYAPSRWFKLIAPSRVAKSPHAT